MCAARKRKEFDKREFERLATQTAHTALVNIRNMKGIDLNETITAVSNKIDVFMEDHFVDFKWLIGTATPNDTLFALTGGS